MQSWLEGRNWVGKCAQATGMIASLRIQSSKADSNTWESFTRSELKLESVHQESPRSDIFRKRDTKQLLKHKHHQKYLTWAKEEKNWTVAQWSKVLLHFICKSRSGGRLERRRIHVLEVQCKVSEVSDELGCRDVCWCWFIVFYQVQSQLSIYQEILELLMLISFSSRTLAPAHTAKPTSKWSADYDISVFDWPDNMPDLNPIWNLWDIFKRKMRNSGSNNTDELNIASAVPQTDRFHSLLTDAGVCAKGAPTKYWVQKLSYFKELELFCFANPFLIDFRKYSNILKYWIFDFH